MTAHEEEVFWTVSGMWSSDPSHDLASIREFRGQRLTMACSTPQAMQELSFRKAELLEKFNAVIQGPQIREIVLVQGAPRR